MRPPSIAQAPSAVLMAIKDTNLAVDRPSRAPIAMAIECDGLHKVLMAVLVNGVEAGTVVGGRRVDQKCGRFGHGGFVVFVEGQVQACRCEVVVLWSRPLAGARRVGR